MRLLLVFSLLLIINVSYAQETNASELFERASQLSNEGNFEEAISLYKKIESQDLSSAFLYYNMGTTYLKRNDIAHAVLYLEKSHRADPSNSDIKNNLEIARSKVNSDILEVPDFVLLRFWRGISKVFSPLIWFVLQLIFGGLLVFGIYKWKLSGETKERAKGFGLSGAALFILMLTVATGFTSEKMIHQKDIAILMKSTDLQTGADDRATPITNLSEGVKLKIKDQIGEWYKVQLINKEEGWIKAADVTLI